MKGINFQCVYDVDDARYPYTAFNHSGELFGFKNPPIRDFERLEWIDCQTGEPGEFIPYLKWDQSLREMKDFIDCHRPRTELFGKKLKPVNPDGKKGVKPSIKDNNE